ncbi:MAG: SOS response-associated peptidase [Methylobacterium sp.]|nr:SOS response-associated peptidase [Methylobacterium sp.]
MCGRFALTLPPEAARQYFGYLEQPNFPPRFDIRPTDPVAVVTATQGARHFMLMRWGFIPGFVKDEKEFPLLINARSETVFEKASFRNAIRRRRCLFIADAFYEWMKLDEKGRKKQPYRIFRPSGEPLAMAGIHETWSSRDGSEIDSCAILTTTANATLAAIHDRMPVILASADFEAWLAPETEQDRVQSLMRPLNDEALVMERIQRVGPPEPEEGKLL